jgi:hypothetical protein
MTELENLKIKLFELVECIGALESKPNGDVIIFTKEQLLTYSKFIINETIDSVKSNIEDELSEDVIDEAIELDLSYNNREITVNIDEKAITRYVVSMVEDVVDEDGLDATVHNTLERVFGSQESTEG